MIISKINLNGPDQNEIHLSTTGTITVMGAIGTSTSVTVEQLGTGAITASSDNTNICTTSVMGNVVIITGTGEGTTTININTAATHYYEAASTTATVEVISYSRVLAENTPAQIQEVAQQGIADSFWDVGDRTAPVSLAAYGNMSATSSVCFFIIGFNHNQSIEGTGIHFQIGKTTSGTTVALVDSGYGSTHNSGTWFGLNNSDTNSGGWTSSNMYNTILPGFYNTSLPTAWKNIIVNTIKYTASKSTSSSAVTSTNQKLWLLAEYEVFGTITSSNNQYEANYQKQYDYYKNGNSKIFYKHNDTATACYWKLRTVNCSSNWSFQSVGTGGTTYDDYYGNISCGFAPGFRVG